MARSSLFGKLKRLPLRGPGPALPKDSRWSQKSRKLTDPTKFSSVGMQAEAISARIDQEMKRDWEKIQRRSRLYDRLTVAAASVGVTSAMIFVSYLATSILDED